MKNLVIISLVLFSINLNAQIEYKTNFWGGKFYEKNEKVKFKNVETILKTVPEAQQEFLKGKMNANLALITSIGGLALELASLSQLLDSDNESTTNLGYTLGGLALIGVSYYFTSQATRQFKNSATIYNKGNNKTSLMLNPSINNNGIGFTLNF